MLQTALAREMGIRVPIFSVGMSCLAGPDLAAAVSNQRQKSFAVSSARRRPPRALCGTLRVFSASGPDRVLSRHTGEGPYPLVERTSG